MVKKVYLGEMMLELSVESLERVNPKWEGLPGKGAACVEPRRYKEKSGTFHDIHGACLSKSCQQWRAG